MHPFSLVVAAARKMSFLLLLPLLAGCEDATESLYPKVQPVELPATTETGANTFGCVVNGDVWEANNATTLAGKALTPNAHYHHGELRINAFRRLQVAGPVTNFSFVLSRVTKPGVYRLAAPRHPAQRYALLETNYGRVGYATDSASAGTLTITRLDTAGARPFVAGRFELRAVPRQSARYANLPAELQVTAGRFDVQLATQPR